MTDQTSQISAAQGEPTVSRRTVLRAAAWTAPAVLVAAATPALAASVQTPGVRLANQVTMDDYVGIGSINSLGGAERFYGRHMLGNAAAGGSWDWTDGWSGPAFHYSIPAEDPRRAANGGAFTDEELHKDFRYRIRVENTGETTLTEVRISFRVDTAGWGFGRLLNNVDESSRTVFDLTDAADSASLGGGTFGGVWSYVWADSGSSADVTLILSGAAIPPGGWVQISPRWWALWDGLFISQPNGNPVPGNHYQWNSVIAVSATDEADDVVTDIQETGNSGTGLWQFDGGRALNYGDTRWDSA